MALTSLGTAIRGQQTTYLYEYDTVSLSNKIIIDIIIVDVKIDKVKKLDIDVTTVDVKMWTLQM